MMIRPFVARLAYEQGSISLQPAGTSDCVAAELNRPVTTGDKIWSDNDGRVELQLGGSLLRLSQNTGCSFLNASDNVTQMQLTSGTLLVRVGRLEENETHEIDTPNLAFSVLRAVMNACGQGSLQVPRNVLRAALNINQTAQPDLAADVRVDLA